MLCPVCKIPLKLTFREDIEIDYCEQCRGVWLDRGELDKLIEKSKKYDNHTYSQSAPVQPQQVNDHHYAEHRDDKNHHNQYPQHGKPHKKKDSFLGDVFDIFG